MTVERPRSASSTPAIAMHSIAIQTAHFDEAFKFYSKILGLTVVREPFRFKTRTLCWLDAGGGTMIELYSLKDGVTGHQYHHENLGIEHVAFVVDDLDAVIEHLKENEVRIIKGPLTPPSGDPRQPRVLFAEGPDGLSVQFREPPLPLSGE